MSQTQVKPIEIKPTEALIEALYRGESLTRQEAKVLFSQIIQGKMDPVSMGGMLVAMKMR
ncbi:anthranilate phosphoribosyltransferase, partial [Shewanella sp. 0m-11]